MGPEIKRAEQEVKKSQQEFGEAMVHLQEKVEDAGERVARTVETVQDTIQLPKRAVQSLMERTKDGMSLSMDAATRIFREARKTAKPVIRSVRNDRRVQAGIASSLLGIVAMVFVARSRRKSTDSKSLRAVSAKKRRKSA